MPGELMEECFRSELHDLATTNGLQAVVDQGGEVVLDLADGTDGAGRTVESDSLFAIYCVGKPAIAAAALVLVQEGDLCLDQPVGAVLDEAGGSWIGRRTIRQLLSHSAGLHEVNEVVARVLPESQRTPWVLSFDPPVGFDFQTELGYSGFAAWHLLGLVLEAVTGQPYEDLVASQVLKPWGVPSDQYVTRFDRDLHGSLGSRIRVSTDPDEPAILLAELGVETACEWNPAFGSYASAAGVVAVLRGLLDDLQGAGRVLSPELAHLMCTTAAEGHDVVLGRRAGYGLGVFTDIEAHHIHGFGGLAFAAAAEGGLGFAVADPELDLAMAVRFDSMLSPTESRIRRQRCARAVARMTQA